jgi:hypothetical protein
LKVYQVAIEFTVLLVVLAASPGNRPVVQVGIRKLVQFSSRLDQKREMLSLGRVDTRTGHKSSVFGRV